MTQTETERAISRLFDRWAAQGWPDEWRHGQALFNLLHDARPDLAAALTGTVYDPFFDDRKIEIAWRWIQEHW